MRQRPRGEWAAAVNEARGWLIVQVNRESYGVNTPAGNAWYESWPEVLAFCQGVEREGWEAA